MIEDRTSARRFALPHDHEWAALLLSGGYFFCVLCAYYILRPVREAMGIERGWENLPLLMTGTLIAMALVNPLFSVIVSRMPRRRFIPITYRFFLVNLLLFFAGLKFLPQESRHMLGYAFYIWLSVFNLFVISIFWAVMADIWSLEQSKRLFGFVSVGGTIGAIVGALITNRLVAHIGQANLMLISCVLLELGCQCVRPLLRNGRISQDIESDQLRNPARSREPGRRILAGVELLISSRFLQLIGLYVFLYTIGSTFLYLEQGRIVEEVEPDRQRRTAIFASIDVWTNVLTLFIQVFVTGQILKWLGFRVALLIVPALTFIAFAVLWYVDHAAALPAVASLYTIGIIQVLRRGSHYAIDRPAREALYTTMGADEKYKAKPIIDTFIYRSGDMVGAWLPRGLAAMSIALAPVAIGSSAVWILVAASLGLMAKRRSTDEKISSA